MKTPFLAVTLLALSTSFANAEVNSLAGKAMEDFAAIRSGSTGQPTARFYSDSLADAALKHRSSLNVGRTANPLSQPDDASLSAKAMKDLGARS